MMISIPEWLNKYPIFCNHKDKQPYAHTDDINTFKPLDVCLDNMKKDKSLGLGIGLFGNLCAIDIDHCVDEAGVVSDTANKILEMFDGCYAEISYSGTGVHLLFFLKEQHKYQKYYTKMNAEHCKNAGFSDIGGLEFYQGSIDNRYFTLTGNIIPAVHNHGYTVSESKIKTFLDTYMKKPTVTSAPAVEYTEDDEEDKAWFNFSHFIYKNPIFLEKFPSVKSLFESINNTDHTGDESQVDLILMNKIAFWANNNPRVMQDVFEKSEWCKTKDNKHLDKWNKRADYRNDYCIIPAINNTKNVAKVLFKDWFYYDKETKTMNIEGFRNTFEGGENMKVYPIEGKENRFTYKNDSNIRYTAQLELSSKGTMYCKWIKGFNCDTKEDLGFINRDNKDYYKIQGHFLKHYND